MLDDEFSGLLWKIGGGDLCRVFIRSSWKVGFGSARGLIDPRRDRGGKRGSTPFA
jgi:hypothetical protein